MVATQLTVTISGGGPYGLRLSDAPDRSIVITKARKGGRADEAGLREADVVIAVNGRSCKGTDASSVSQWIDNSGQKVSIQVMRVASDTPSQDKSQETVTVPRAQPDQFEHADQRTPTKTILRQEVRAEHEDFTITAPSGVDVQQNADKSFTVTIGMPFQLGLNASVEDHQKQEVQQQQLLSNDRPAEETPPRQVVQQKQLERILSEGSGSEPNTPDDLPRPGKKLFVDSAFYDDPEHKYPTVNEQIQLARQVAFSVISPHNLKSKGHRMFMKRKERSIRWTTGLSEEEKAELADQMAAARAAEAAGEPLKKTVDDSQTPQSAPSAMPTSVMFAPKLPKEKDTERLNAMSNEELDMMVMLERKTTHTNVSPQVCFNLVDDLRNVKGKGGKLFAKRQARAEKWDAEKAQGEDEGQEGEEGNESGVAGPDPQLVEKLKAEHREKLNSNRDQKSTPGGGGAPVNRLKEMIEVPKAAITPWDAVAQFGSVEKAFEHLEKVPGIQQPGQQQSLAEALQQQQQRRREAGGTRAGIGAVRPKSTIGGVGIGRTGNEETSGADEQKVKIEAIGGNPNAASLAAAMKSSLSSARSSRGGVRYGRSKPSDTGGTQDHSTNQNSTIGTLNA